MAMAELQNYCVGAFVFTFPVIYIWINADHIPAVLPNETIKRRAGWISFIKMKVEDVYPWILAGEASCCCVIMSCYVGDDSWKLDSARCWTINSIPNWECWSVVWKKQNIYNIKMNIYLRTKVLHGCLKPKSLLYNNKPTLPFPLLTLLFKRNLSVKRLWKNVHPL